LVARALKRRYGHAPAKSDVVSNAITFAPWVKALLVEGEAKSLCLYEIVKAALVTRGTAIELGGDPKLIAKADAALNAIGSGKIRDHRTAAAALRKYVRAYGGSTVEADVLMP
jgi:hypothetical protein